MRTVLAESGPRLLRRKDPMPRRRPRGRTAAMMARAALQAILLVGVPVGLAGWVAFSGYFLVDTVAVRSAERVARPWAEQALAPIVGRHILTLSLPEVTEALAGHPWVASVSVTKELPRGVVVAIEEKRPVAVWLRGEDFDYLDIQGQVIAPAAGEELAELLPQMVWPRTAPVPVQGALELLEELRALRPSWAAEVRRVEILSDGDYRLHLGRFGYQLVLRAGTLARALPRLDRALEEIGDRASEMEVIDLRLARRVVLRAAAATAEPTNRAEPSRSAAKGEG